jgi:DNA repair exonuclease SbcCD nuclease subunit
MLLIWDIHIHPRYGDSLIQMLRDFVQKNNHETHIIFVGDYVYHFSYHRPSLLVLLDFFLELTEQWKTIYVLAGNHDRLGQHFVYAEAEKIQNLKSKIQTQTLHFITTPQIIRIESEDIFFLPYMLNWKDTDELNEYISKTINDWENREKTITLSKLWNSKSLSKLTLIHHYYVAETAFPGLKVKFTYKDLALQPRWLDDERLVLISGHIHHAFSYKNYLCVGAVWSTSPVEINQLQYLFSYNATTQQLSAYQVALNPYLQCEREGGQISHDFLHTQWDHLITAQKGYFASSQFDKEIVDAQLPVDRVTLSLVSNELHYEQLPALCDNRLTDTLRDIKLKRKYDTLDLSIEQLTNETQNFSDWRGDRKQLLDDYLTQKFGDRKAVYEAMLKEVGI